MSPDEQKLSERLPESLKSRTELVRACRRDPALQAMAEGLVLFERLGDFEQAFKHPLTIGRIRDHGGEAAVTAYSNAVARIQDPLKKGSQQSEQKTF
jgi:hypothetical protein